MARLGSYLRIIIYTIAFGMGIDCKDTYRSIHFGPPKTVELLVQESGRIGRDGKQCISYILHNGLLSSHCNGQMKQLMQTQSCRREYIVSLFSVTNNKTSEKNCLCCDNCALLCQCNNSIQTMEFGKNADVRSYSSIPAKTRPVSDAQRQELHQKLLTYRKTLLPKSVTEFMPVGAPNVFLNLDDIPLLLEEEFQEIEVLATDWEFVRDDSTLNDLQSSVLSDLETSVENSLANSVTNEHSMSEIFSSLASTAE
ncbi:mediator of RNA polymerase II transcription subunit 34-like, partial [Paramuricea clavata]